MEDNSSPGIRAIEKQLAQMNEMGIPCPQNCSVAEASELISLGRFVLCYAIQLAWQEWRQDLSHADLRPIVEAVFSVPGMAEQIREIMDSLAQAAALANDEREAQVRAGSSSRKLKKQPVSVVAEPVKPDLREDASYFFVKLRLQNLFPNIALLAPPKPPATQPHARVYLATDSGFFERIVWWIQDHQQ